MPDGKVRFSTISSGIHVSMGGKNGVPPPTAAGWTTTLNSSTSPARIRGAASVGLATSISPSVSSFSCRATSTGSPRSSRAFPSTVSRVWENTTFGTARHARAKSTVTGVADGSSSAVGQ